MSDSTGFHLRLFSDEGFPAVPIVPGIPEPFVEIARSFEALTGWHLGYQSPSSTMHPKQGVPGAQPAPHGQFFIEDLSEQVDASNPAANRPRCEAVARDLTQLSASWHQMRAQLQASEAELATHSVVRVGQTESVRLSQLFAQLLSAAVELTGYESAALSMLDQENGRLSFRHVHGPHFADAVGVSRMLKHCKADLEALTGNLVVLSKRAEAAIWAAPVPCRSAICLPVSSLDNLLGTLWLVSERRRDISDRRSNLLEIIAGRIAAAIERVALVRHLQSVQHEDDGSQVDSDVQPPFPGWSLQQLSEPFEHDTRAVPRSTWRVTADEQLALLMFYSRGPMADAHSRRALTAFENFAFLDLTPRQLLEGLRRSLQQNFDSPCIDSVACVMVDPLTGETRSHHAGQFEFTLRSAAGNGSSDGKPRVTDGHSPLFLTPESSLIIHHPHFAEEEFSVVLQRTS